MGVGMVALFVVVQPAAGGAGRAEQISAARLAGSRHPAVMLKAFPTVCVRLDEPRATGLHHLPAIAYLHAVGGFLRMETRFYAAARTAEAHDRVNAQPGLHASRYDSHRVRTCCWWATSR